MINSQHKVEFAPARILKETKTLIADIQDSGSSPRKPALYEIVHEAVQTLHKKKIKIRLG